MICNENGSDFMYIEQNGYRESRELAVADAPTPNKEPHDKPYLVLITLHNVTNRNIIISIMVNISSGFCRCSINIFCASASRIQKYTTPIECLCVTVKGT